jgi:hypothetical protein
MLETAQETGLDRAGLYRSFAKGGDPRISTFDKVARSFGYRLSLVPVKAASSGAPGLGLGGVLEQRTTGTNGRGLRFS